MEQYPSEPITKRYTTKRCINLDWLEVHAREPEGSPRNAEYFRAKGIWVRERAYGTRVYKEMFTIEGSDMMPLLEVRRNPASQGLYGIHDANECHIRLVNRTCYFDNAAEYLDNFLSQHGYTDVRISRVDICLDFVTFDKGDDPQAFVRRYFRHKYAKINQGRISGHGEDTWSGQEWNSISWGSKTSPVSTKLYNKTMELYDPKSDSFGKPYIREAWLLCGIIDDMQRVTKNGEPVQVWRVEFSLKSAVKNWIALDLNGNDKEKQSLRNTLEVYYNRANMLVMFASLANHYFRFKKYKAGKRKDRCPDKILFDFVSPQVTYKIGRPDTAAGLGNALNAHHNRLITQLRLYQSTHTMPDIYKACETLITSMSEEDIKNDLADPYSREQFDILKTILSWRVQDPNISFEVAMSQIKKMLNITDRTISVF